MKELKNIAITELNKRGINIADIGLIVYDLQKQYNPHITLSDCNEAVDNVLTKREVIHAILTGISLDICAERRMLEPTVNDFITNDSILYGVDEILALGIVNIYGSIAFTTFGYLDKVKPGIIGEIDQNGKQGKKCYTFLDDIVSAIAAAAASKIAHNKKIN